MTKSEKVYAALHSWCSRRGIRFDIACDESEVQGYTIFHRDASKIPDLLRFLKPLLVKEGVDCNAISLRVGTVLMFSEVALSEEVLLSYINQTQFADQLDHAFHGEQQYYFPSVRTVKQNKKSPRQRFTVAEDMNGMAADYQPDEVLQHMDAAMKELGLHDRLKEAQITNRLSDDRLSLVFFVKDAAGSNRPIATYNLTTLGKANELQKALDHLNDLSKKQAPGAGEQFRQSVKDQEQAIRNVAKNFAMPDPNQQNAPLPAPAQSRMGGQPTAQTGPGGQPGVQNANNPNAGPAQSPGLQGQPGMSPPADPLNNKAPKKAAAPQLEWQNKVAELFMV